MASRVYEDTVTIPSQELVPTNDGKGTKWANVGTKSGRVVVIIDIEKLRPLMRKALANKGLKSTAICGAVVCQVLSGTVRFDPPKEHAK